jgi:hypothetical protein
MPAQQRRRCDDEGPPAGTRQEPAGRREEEPVGPRHCRTAGSSPEDGEFLPEDDNFQLFEVVRPNVQGSQLEHPPEALRNRARGTRSPQRSQTTARFYASALRLTLLRRTEGAEPRDVD